MTIWVLVLGALLGVGLLQLRWLAFPSVVDLADGVEQWRRGRERAGRRAEATQASRSPLGRLTEWVTELLAAYRPGYLSRLRPDLAITRRELQPWLAKTIGLTLAFLLGPTVVLLARDLTGQSTALLWGPVLGVVLAALAVLLSVRDLKNEADARRQEYTRALSLYLDLVAMSMEAGHGHAAALPAAAQIGDGGVFTEIRLSIELAPTKGISAWEALGQMGEAYAIPELVTLRSTIELAQDDGARVKASLIARAATMRANRLAASLERSTNATEKMRQLIMAAAVVSVVYFAMPYLLVLRGAATVPGGAP